MVKTRYLHIAMDGKFSVLKKIFHDLRERFAPGSFPVGWPSCPTKFIGQAVEIEILISGSLWSFHEGSSWLPLRPSWAKRLRQNHAHLLHSC